MAEAKSINPKDILVLIVDDEPDILELMEEEFNYHGYKTMTAICGNDAIDLIRKNNFNVVVSDYKMPNGNGMAVLKEVSTMAAIEKPVFFFVSGQADISIEEAIDAGAKKFFAKPFDLEELISEIEVELISALK
ncbi:response regulator receiver domain protein [Bacteriovorax sp. BSW11_IV]|uniref:response regulator n=1 Tax=Bacteriovorax sp. BSW11_IV TaxID=1353529 RepID=UPI000389D9CD|nr:response regulator [Bacteriovorax sp. BSW11_IV]EQC44513.1 response regulator receiver domain protein [Bacteriovorax sp. BSW11_IV]